MNQIESQARILTPFNELSQGPSVMDSVRSSRPLRYIAAGLSAISIGGIAAEHADAAPISPVPSVASELYTDLTPTAVVDRAQSRSVSAGRSIQDQSVMNATGKDMVNSVPGMSVDFSQVTEKIEATPTGAVRASFLCPAPSKSFTTTKVKSVEIGADNKANVEFCPSYSIIKFSNLSRSNPRYNSAIADYRSDSRRTTPWGGDKDGTPNLFYTCPAVPKTQSPLAKLSLKGRVANVSFDGGGISRYCDEVGQYTEEVSLEVQRKGTKSFKKVGNSVLHVAGLNEIFVSTNKFPYSAARTKVAIPNVDVCKGTSSKGANARVRITQRFSPMQTQEFQGQKFNGSVNMKSGSATKVSAAKKVC